MTEPPSRSRTHEWTDPGRLAEATQGLSGREFFEAWGRRESIPPMAATLDFSLGDFEEGRVEIVCRPQEFHYSPYGMAHGGLAATLLDTATGCAIHTRLPLGGGYATVGLNVSFLRPITTDTGVVRGVGTVVSMGRRVAVAEGQITDAGGRLLAKGTATCLVLEPDSPRT